MTIDITDRFIKTIGVEQSLEFLWTLKLGFAKGLCNGEEAVAYGLIYDHTRHLAKLVERQYLSKERENLKRLIPFECTYLDKCAQYILYRDRLQYFLESKKSIGQFYGVYTFPDVKRELRSVKKTIKELASEAARRKEV